MVGKPSDKHRFMVEWHDPNKKHGDYWSYRYFKHEQRARDCAAKLGGTVCRAFFGGWTRLDDTA